MNTAKLLMMLSEVLVVGAIVAHIVLPASLGVSLTVSANRIIGIPIRWFVPLFLISIAGALSATALVKMVWALAHAAVSR